MNKITEKIKTAKARTVAALMVAGGTAASMVTPAFASSTGDLSGLFSTASGLTNDALAGMQSLLTPLALLAIVICGAGMIITKDQKKMETYKAWLIRIIIVTVIIFAAGPIISFAQKLGSNISF